MRELGHVVCKWEGWSSWVAISTVKRMSMVQPERESEREAALDFLNIHDNRDVGLSYLFSAVF